MAKVYYNGQMELHMWEHFRMEQFQEKECLCIQINLHIREISIITMQTAMDVIIQITLNQNHKESGLMDFQMDLANKYIKTAQFTKDSLNKVKEMEKAAIILQMVTCTVDNGNKI